MDNKQWDISISEDGNMIDVAIPLHEMVTEEEWNQILYRDRKEEVEQGIIEDWPDDDSGIVMGFLRGFLTPEMRESFSEIAKEYLRNETDAFLEPQPFDALFLQNSEKDLRDVYYLRILAVMLHNARKGSAYSTGILTSLYKTYHGREYKYLKRLHKLTIKDVWDMYVEDCYDKGYKIRGGIAGNNPDYREIVWERRRNEPGWTNIQSDGDAYDGRFDCPIHVDPPSEDIISRLFVMCELLNIPIDPTCNREAVKTDEIVKNEFYVKGEPDYILDQFIERVETKKNWLVSECPELNSPAGYQADEHFGILRPAEFIMRNTFKWADLDFGIVYGTRKFDLAGEMAEAMTVMDEYCPADITFNECLLLATVSYLSKCIGDAIRIQKKELAGFFGLYESWVGADWDADSGNRMNVSYLSEEKTDNIKRKEQKLFRAIRNFKPEEVDGEKQEDIIQEEVRQDRNLDVLGDTETETDLLKEKITELKQKLEQARRDVSYQKNLCADIRRRAEKLERENATMKAERKELIALREFAYSIAEGDFDEAYGNEPGEEEMVSALRDKKVTILGGSQTWHKGLKEKFPGWSYIAVDDGNVREGMIEGADYIYVYAGLLKHAQYRQARKIMRKMDKEMFFISGRNIEDNIRQFHRDLCRLGNGKKDARILRKGSRR